MASESWVAAEQALSLLVEQHGVTTRAAGQYRCAWLQPYSGAALDPARGPAGHRVRGGRGWRDKRPQAEAIDRLKNQLAR